MGMFAMLQLAGVIFAPMGICERVREADYCLDTGSKHCDKYLMPDRVHYDFSALVFLGWMGIEILAWILRRGPRALGVKSQ